MNAPLPRPSGFLYSPMFPLGSADMLEPARELIAQVTKVIMRLPNKITITGHTDSTQYTGSGQYSNWELSADRANASRRAFIADGLQADRIAKVIGMARSRSCRLASFSRSTSGSCPRTPPGASARSNITLL